VVVASIGNSGANGLWSAGAPGVGEGVIGVASFDNIRTTNPAFSVSPDTTANFGYDQATAAPIAPRKALPAPIELARTGTPTTTNDGCNAFTGVSGKMVLIRRGTCGFFVKALNATLPHDVRVRGAWEMSQAFHATLDAKAKLYRYVIDNHPIADPFQTRYSHHVYRRLDVAAMGAAARSLEGRHDFHSFETDWPNRMSSVRTITHLALNRMGDWIWLDVEADGFLYNMVRAIAGTLMNVGRGYWPATQVAAFDRYAKLLDPDGYVPVRMTGSVTSPSVAMPSVGDMLQNAVESKAKDLLGGFLDKAKKPPEKPPTKKK